MRFLRIFLPAAAAALALTGCSAKHAATTPAANATPAPAATTATTAQYGKALHGSIVAAQKTWKRYTDAGCQAGGTKQACTITPKTLNQESNAIVMEIEACGTLGSPGFVGAPPAELAELVDNTQFDAQQLVGDTADPDQPAPSWRDDALTLMQELHGWNAYPG